jgi:hypothetical protein
MRVLWFFVFCPRSDLSEYMANIYGFNLWSVPSFIFWSLVVDATAVGVPSVRRRRASSSYFRFYVK